MIRPSRAILVGFGCLLALGVASAAWMAMGDRPASLPFGLDDTETVEITDYAKPKDDDTPLVDDRLEDKKTTFDPSLVDRRPLDGWSVNASEAVIRLDVPMARPDLDPEQLVLHPSYLAALKASKAQVLPSVNMVDGKAKQFDDGLYAAIDRAYYVGHGDSMKGHLQTLRRIYDQVSKPSPAADYLAAGLGLGGVVVEASPRAKSLGSSFLAVEVRSKPISFYTWDSTLSECFRVLRFFAQPIEDRSIPLEIARVLREDKALLDDYTRAIGFYAGLTNPLVGRSPAGLIDGPPLGPREQVTLFPPSTSREAELFSDLFPTGLPSHAHLMRELILAIRSGKVDLKPKPSGGWYDHQVYALETLLLPERAAESNKLLLTRAYKKRMLEAFQALMTKRRETHARQLIEPKSEAMMPSEKPAELRPRLRVEPNPTYYLRTARSYAFLANFLEATLGESTLKSLKGLREGGERDTDLHAELHQMRDLFYGLALLSAEDIGARIDLLEGEAVDREAAEKVAETWLSKLGLDRDLAADTRVSVPVYYDPLSGKVRLWATLGVRLTALDASYVRPPSLRPVDGSSGWEKFDPDHLRSIAYRIPVDEFAEVEVGGGRVFDRAELRGLCDRMKTKAKILDALRN